MIAYSLKDIAILSAKGTTFRCILMGFSKYGAKCETSLRFWENKGWIDKIYPYGWF